MVSEGAIPILDHSEHQWWACSQKCSFRDGDAVAAYQPLAIVEAMKVMATIESPFAGRIKHVYVKKGAQLKHGELIVDVEPLETK